METTILQHLSTRRVTFKLHSPRSVFNRPLSAVKKIDPPHCIEVHSLPRPETDLNSKQKENSDKLTFTSSKSVAIIH